MIYLGMKSPLKLQPEKTVSKKKHHLEDFPDSVYLLEMVTNLKKATYEIVSSNKVRMLTKKSIS